MKNTELQHAILKHIISINPGIKLLDAINRLSESHKVIEGTTCQS